MIEAKKWIVNQKRNVKMSTFLAAMELLFCLNLQNISSSSLLVPFTHSGQSQSPSFTLGTAGFVDNSVSPVTSPSEPDIVGFVIRFKKPSQIVYFFLIERLTTTKLYLMSINYFFIMLHTVAFSIRRVVFGISKIYPS